MTARENAAGRKLICRYCWSTFQWCQCRNLLSILLISTSNFIFSFSR